MLVGRNFLRRARLAGEGSPLYTTGIMQHLEGWCTGKATSERGVFEAWTDGGRSDTTWAQLATNCVNVGLICEDGSCNNDLFRALRP